MTDRILLGDTMYWLDFRGHLKTFSMWSPELMDWFAQQEEIVNFLRMLFSKRQVHPVVRIVTAYMVDCFGRDKGTIRYFHSLFPKGIHQAYRIAGLPPLVLSV
jgi:TusE/DsrC/DsvC family sulfur relay protein